jgi:hypothetical protein
MRTKALVFCAIVVLAFVTMACQDAVVFHNEDGLPHDKPSYLKTPLNGGTYDYSDNPVLEGEEEIQQLEEEGY